MAKSSLKPLELRAAPSTTDVGIHIKIIRFGTPLDVAQQMTLLVISIKKMEDIMIIFTSIDGTGLFITGDIQTIVNGTMELVSWYVIMYFRCYCIRKYVSR